MARIAGVTLPREKRVVIGLTYIFGIGAARASRIVEKAGIASDVRVKDLTDDQTSAIRAAMEGTYRVEGDLRREILGNIKRLKDLGTYRGDRHAKRLPVRGQRTKTNSRTIRGNVRKTAGSGRRTIDKK